MANFFSFRKTAFQTGYYGGRPIKMRFIHVLDKADLQEDVSDGGGSQAFEQVEELPRRWRRGKGVSSSRRRRYAICAPATGIWKK